MLSGMASDTGSDPKAELQFYLRRAREALLWKLAGLSDYGVRRPLVPTGTNLLGLVKHVASVASEYFGAVFDRPFPQPMPWMAEGAEPNADLWATAEESRAQIVELYHRVWAHADATIAALSLDAPGRVPWWPPERAEVTLRVVMVHMIAEVHRHAGHADIVRELIDGAAGTQPTNDNMPHLDAAWWADYRDRLERTASDAAS
jgi:uncharacterized damage-inducible protein DinB